MAGAYLTADEYLAHPSSVDVSSLVVSGQYADQRAALVSIISEASGWIDNVCNQPLISTQRTEFRTSRWGPNGLAVTPYAAKVPVVLDAISTGTSPLDQVAMDPSAAWVENGVIKVGASVLAGTTVLTVGNPYNMAGQFRGQVLARITYTSGWPCTTFTGGAAQAATSLSVASTLGMAAGQVLSVADGPAAEKVTVASVDDAGTITITAGLVSAHLAGAPIHALPEDVKLAAVLATSGFLKGRSADALVMGALQQPSAMPQAFDPERSANLRLARSILQTNYEWVL